MVELGSGDGIPLLIGCRSQRPWDSILSSYRFPRLAAALGIELRASVLLWRGLEEHDRRPCGTLLDLLFDVALDERLELPRLAVLAAFRLHRRLLSRSTRSAA